MSLIVSENKQKVRRVIFILLFCLCALSSVLYFLFVCFKLLFCILFYTEVL